MDGFDWIDGIVIAAMAIAFAVWVVWVVRSFAKGTNIMARRHNKPRAMFGLQSSATSSGHVVPGYEFLPAGYEYRWNGAGWHVVPNRDVPSWWSQLYGSNTTNDRKEPVASPQVVTIPARVHLVEVGDIGSDNPRYTTVKLKS